MVDYIYFFLVSFLYSSLTQKLKYKYIHRTIAHMHTDINNLLYMYKPTIYYIYTHTYITSNVCMCV